MTKVLFHKFIPMEELDLSTVSVKMAKLVPLPIRPLKTNIYAFNPFHPKGHFGPQSNYFI